MSLGCPVSEWNSLRLDEVADRVAIKNTAGIQRVMTVSAEHGLIDQEKFFTKRVASNDLSGYWVIQPGDFVYNKSTSKDAPRGVVARYESDVPAVVTSLYIVFRAREDVVDPAFLQLACNSTAFFDSLRGTLREGARAHGLLNVRLKEFFGAQVSVPNMMEQRRIVEVLGAVDAQAQALKDELEKSAHALDLLITHLFSEMPSTRALAEFTATRSGPSYAAADVTSEPVEGSMPVIGIPNTRPDGTIDLSEIGYVSGLPGSVNTIDESSLVLIRTNGNRQRIGNVYLPPVEAHGCAVSAFQFLMKVADPADREYVYWALREPSMQAAMSEAASGTTGLGNLAVKWLNSARVYWSEDAGQRVAATTSLRAQQNVVDGLRDELAHLRSFRSTLLSTLLTQEIEIPDSYDDLLEKVS